MNDPPLGAITGALTAGIALFTLTVTVVEVAVLPIASLATAVKAWLAFETEAVSQVIPYGLEVSSAPRLVPSNLNWTPTTPTLSVAVADNDTPAPETVAF